MIYLLVGTCVHDAQCFVMHFWHVKLVKLCVCVSYNELHVCPHASAGRTVLFNTCLLGRLCVCVCAFRQMNDMLALADRAILRCWAGRDSADAV